MSRPTQGHQRNLPVRGYHPLWPDFPDGSGSYANATGLVRVRSPLLAESRLISFPPATEMFQFAGFASMRLWIQRRITQRVGFPHSDMPGSKIAPISPGLFAGCHVLLRLLPPRHPPDALLLLHQSLQKQTQPKIGSASALLFPSSQGRPPASLKNDQSLRHSPYDNSRHHTALSSQCQTAPGHPGNPSTGMDGVPNPRRSWWRRTGSNR